MVSLFEKVWIRMLALVLFFVSLAAAMIALPLYTQALGDGWYGKEDFTFADSELCRSYVIQNLRYIKENIEWLGDPTDTSLGNYGGAAFSYVVTSVTTGEIMADTRTESSCFVMNYDDIVEIADGAMYRLAGYVNLPVQPYEGCYTEYYIFEHLFPLRDFFLPVLVVGTLLAAAALAFSICAAGVTGRRGNATLLGKVPFDAAVVLLLLASTVGANYLIDLLIRQVTHQVLLYRSAYALMRMCLDFFHLSNIFKVYALALGACCLANQLANHTFQSRLLLRRMVIKTPPMHLAAALLVVHALVLVFVLAVDQVMRVSIVLGLVFFDMALIPCVLRWSAESRCVRDAANALAAGDFTVNLSGKKLHMDWKELGLTLSRIGDGMAAAVEERMRSERMKTELITNVSHDLKTPLTSIISYIDLLHDPTLSEAARMEYVGILDRQSAKLKKLTEDVVEASKAASGAVKVDPELFDVGELLTQAVGEYNERLLNTGIDPIIHTPPTETYLFADGRLLGRVLDNLITNIIKYAQPGTRAYFDLTAGPEKTVIAVKNTSRYPLDIPAEELLERFVRGDSSRASEGSGLGLSIARSLTELMGGQLRLILDGDLFKAEVTFPSADPPEAKRSDGAAAE